MQNKLSDWAKLNSPWAYEVFGRNKLFFFLHLFCTSFLKVVWYLISQIKHYKLGCKEVVRSPSYRIPGWLQTWDSTVAFFTLKLWFCLKTFKCSLYVIFYIKSKQPASINKKGVLDFTFLKFMCALKNRRKY